MCKYQDCPESLVLVFLRLPEALTVQSLPGHLHHGLDLRIHIQDAPLTLPLLTLEHKTQEKFSLPANSSSL